MPKVNVNRGVVGKHCCPNFGEGWHRNEIAAWHGVFGIIKRELCRRSAIEAVIGHPKTDGHLGRCHLEGFAGDDAKVILSAVGHNLRVVLAWVRALLCMIVTVLRQTLTAQSALKSAS
jgi:IS5 family transposase